MKTKLFSLLLTTYFLLLTFCLSPCTAQVPQGFNYQAIARNATGLPITNQVIPVRISIVTALTSGTVIWQEEHSSVTADQFGMISLVVGTGTQTGGSAASFSAINWSAQTLFLKTEVKYPGPGWTDMGTSQIWAVPYSLVAKSIEGPLVKLGINGTTDNMEESLFEVKNKAGNTVFAVYNEGVRIYVGNGDAKGTKGGFSVGGYDETKGVHNLLTVNSDSVRVYLDNNPSKKGIKGGFAVGGYDMTKGSENKYLSVSPDSTMVYLQSQSKDSSSTFNIVALNENNGRKYLLQANTDTVGIAGVLNVKNNLVVNGDINISGTTVQDTSLVTDRDGNTYKTIRIGQQIWMAEDLKTAKYNDGTAIPNITDNTEWISLSTPGYCWYNNDKGTYKPVYGALYNWFAVSTGMLCPQGWHVPSDNDWTDLENFLGYEGVGGQLKEVGTNHWASPNQGATNGAGFTALPGGSRTTDGLFDGTGLYNNWWTSTDGEGSAYYRSASYDSGETSSGAMDYTVGAAVRCIFGGI